MKLALFNEAELFFTQPWVVRLGWTLLHFLWQGTLIAIVFAVARALLSRSLTAHARYFMACTALGLMTAAPLLTYPALATFRAETTAPSVWQMFPARDWRQALPWLVMAWLGGVIVFSARLAGGWRQASRMRFTAVTPAPAEWQQRLEGLIRHMGAWQPVRLLISSLVEVPTVVGWLRPVILMPVGALTGLPAEHVSALLAHELAHVRRHDYLANILQSVVEAVLFYHPAVWWVSDQIRAERELCCDDLAVAACGGDVLTYARALADVESFRPSHAGTVLAANGGSLVSRIRRLIGQAPSASQSLPGPGAVLSLALLWLAGIGAVTMHGSTVHGSTVHGSTEHASIMQGSISPPPPPAVTLPSPIAPLIAPPPKLPVLSALFFDPFFEPPQAAAPAPSSGSISNPASNPNSEKPKIRLEGSVLSLGGGRVSKAAVRLLPSGSSNGQPPPSTYNQTSDDAGKFVFENVAPGRYTLTASKPGFVTGRYGARGPNSPGTLIAVDSGQTMTELGITLTPNGVITGRITDQDGDPLAGSQVAVMRSSYARGRRQMVTAGAGVTDDQGNFRVPNLPPGRYYLGARPPIPGATGDGGDRNGPHDSSVPTYYPNSLDAANASPLNVIAGAELQGIDIRLRQLRVYEFKAKLVNGIDGTPATGVLNLLRYDPSSRNETHPMGEGIREGGKVDYHNLPPGTYVAEISSNPSSGGIILAGRNEFTITDQNVNTVLTFGPAVSLSGTFKLEDGDLQSVLGLGALKTATAQNQASLQAGGPANAPLNVSSPRPRIALSPAEGSAMLGGSNGQLKDDNTFVTTPTGPGKYFLDISGIPDGTYVKSIRYSGQDVTHSPLEVAPGAAGSIDIVLSANAADVSGIVRSIDDEPMAGVRVTVWPKTAESGSSTGGVKSVATDQNGNFKIGGLAPGGYYVAAWEDIDPTLTQDPAFLSGFTSDAAEVKLSDSSHESANVKPIPTDKIAIEAAKIP